MDLTELNNEFEKHRSRRELLNSRVREFARKRDGFNAKLRESRSQADEHKNKRDSTNEMIQSLKKERIETSDEIKSILREIKDIKDNLLGKKGPLLSKLKKQLRDLEFQQQTSVLSPAKERELVEHLSNLESEVKGREEILAKNKRLNQLITQLKETKQKEKKLKREMKAIAELAQIEHESMSALYKEVSKLRSKANEAQSMLIRTKDEADKEHANCIQLIEEIKALERGQRRTRVKKVDSEAQIASVYEKLKSGEKLSTEDFLLLQKAESTD